MMKGHTKNMKNIIRQLLIMVMVLAGEGVSPAGHAVTIDADTIKTAVRNYIETTMPWPAGTMRMEFPVRVADVSLVTIGTGGVRYQVRSRQQEDFLGDSAFTIGFYEEGTLVKEEVVRVRMEVLRETVVSSRVLTRDAEIGPKDIRIVKKWMREVPLNAPAGADDVIGKRITASIRPNTEITTSMLRDVLVIKKGKMVQIMIDNGLMRVIGIGVSEENGAYGAMIKVKNTASNKTILARVEGESLVRVDLQ